MVVLDDLEAVFQPKLLNDSTYINQTSAVKKDQFTVGHVTL